LEKLQWGVEVGVEIPKMEDPRVVRVVVDDMVRMVVVKLRLHKGMVLVMLVVTPQVQLHITGEVEVVPVQLGKLVPQLI
tara:strand:- start:372 stop:608 length:237 start_codon:yes stop_codon:yes gene_type:complete